MADFAPTHPPGEILMTEFLEPMGITQYRIAKAIDVSARRINEIVHGKRSITADTALRLSRAWVSVTCFFHQHAGALRRRDRARAPGDRAGDYRADRLGRNQAHPPRSPALRASRSE